MAIAVARTLLRFSSHRLTLTVDDHKADVDTPLLFVGNNDYRLALPAAGRRDTLDDGELCVMVMRKKGVPGFLAAVARALLGIPRADDMVRIDGVTRLRVDSTRSSIRIAMDGETLPIKPPLDFRIRPGALKVIAPA
jgi:diacylglycerol kinase family enzyme